MKNQQETKKKDKGYTVIGIRTKQYLWIKGISDGLEIPKIKVLSDLVRDLPSEYVSNYVDKQIKRAYTHHAKKIEKLREKVINMAKRKLKVPKSF